MQIALLAEVLNWSSYFNSAQIHGLMDDVVIVMQAESHSIHRLIEGPGVGSVPLGEHLLQNAATVFNPFGELDPAPHLVLLWRIRQIFTWRFDGSAAASTRVQLQHLRLGDTWR